MTYDECQELLSTLMEAVARLVDTKLSSSVKSEVGIVRLIDGDNVYIRPSSDVSTPANISPASVAQLDDGDIVAPNISGNTLAVGDCVELLYTTTIDNAVIVRKIPYTSTHVSGEMYSVALQSDTNIPSETPVNVTSVTLEAGVWILVGRVRFSANAVGYRRANIHTTFESPNAHIQVPAVDGAVTQLELTKIVSVSETTQYYLNAYQNSGSTLQLQAGGDGEINALSAVRVA